MSQQFEQSIALALSGGGTRAMAYHLGVLKFLAERKLFERVTKISTVSGGSLVIGFVYKSAEFRWPSSEHFLKKTLPELTELLCNRSLQAEAFSQLFWPPNLRHVLSRANLVAIELQEHWGFNVALKDLQSGPAWSINGTNAQNGRRFRFKGTEIGDYDVGYAEVPDFPLACALAVSAAFPIGIGPLRIKTDDFVWMVRPFGAPKTSAKVTELDYEYIDLYDGGLYDNLGLEPLFDLGKQESKGKDDYIIVSDAGAPFTFGTTWGPLSPGRLKRMMDIMSDQTRALRVRSFVSYLQQNPCKGAFIPIGTDITAPKCPEAQFARTFPTTLERFDRRDFERLLCHGYDVAAKTDRDFGVYGPATVPIAEAAPALPVASAAPLPKIVPPKVKPSFAQATSPYAHLGKREDAEQETAKPLLFFEALDIAFARLVGIEHLKVKVPKRLKRSNAWWQRFGEEFFSPAIAIAVIGMFLLVADWLHPPAVSHDGVFRSWSAAAAEEFKPAVPLLAFALFGLSLALAGLPGFQRTRIALLRAVAKLSQDAALVAFGVLFILGSHDLVLHGLSAGAWAGWIVSSLLLLAIGVVVWWIREITFEYVTGAALSWSGLIISFLLGSALVYASSGLFVGALEEAMQLSASRVE